MMPPFSPPTEETPAAAPPILASTTTTSGRVFRENRSTSNNNSSNNNDSSCAVPYYDYNDTMYYYAEEEEDTLGMQLTSGKCVITKDARGMIGISIGGGAPHCPCVFIAQVLEKSPAAVDGSLQVGDELVAINGLKCKGARRQDVVNLIRRSTSTGGEGATVCTILYNKLHADNTQQSKTLDIVLKKIKHRLVEALDDDTADALGLSRAIIANDVLASKITYLEELEKFYSELVALFTDIMRNNVRFGHTQRRIGELFAQMAVRETRAAHAFERFSHVHSKLLAKQHLQLVRDCRPAFMHMSTILRAALPDMKQSLQKYLDAKFEYLSFCLKTKELDEEEREVYEDLHESLYRVASGNYEYRAVLRSREQARRRFNSQRKDIGQKLDLLESVHVKKLTQCLFCFVGAQARHHEKCAEAAEALEGIFPIEPDVPYNAFRYTTEEMVAADASPTSSPVDEEEEEEEEENSAALVEFEQTVDNSEEAADGSSPPPLLLALADSQQQQQQPQPQQ